METPIDTPLKRPNFPNVLPVSNVVKNLAEICPVTIPEISLSKKSVTIVEIPFRSALKPQNFRLRRSFYNAKSHLVALSTRKNFACGAHSLMQLKKAMTL